MKNKILLILFSLFAFSVPQQTQPMNAVKQIAQESCKFVKNNSFLVYLYCIVSMNQSNYDNLFFLRHPFFRYFTKAIIYISVADVAESTRVELLSTLLSFYNLYKMYKAYLNMDQAMISDYEFKAFSLVCYAVMLRVIADYKPEYISKILKYTFVLLFYKNRANIINHLGANL